MKLVLLYKHLRPIGIHIPNKGISFPKQTMVSTASPINGAPNGASAMEIDLDHVFHVDLLPEEPEPLPKSLENSADPEFIREYKLSQAREIAQNIKQNEALLRALQSHVDAGNLKILGRAKMDNKGNFITSSPVKEEVKPSIEENEPELLKAPTSRRGRKAKDNE